MQTEPEAWAITDSEGGFIQKDEYTGQLEIYETEQDAKIAYAVLCGASKKYSLVPITFAKYRGEIV